MDKVGDIMDHFSGTLSPDIFQYATDDAFRDSRYIFTWKIENVHFGYCTHCKSTFATIKLRHNQETICPECLSGCMVKSTSYGHKKMIDEAYFVYYQKSILDPSIITAMGIHAVRDYRGDFRKVETQYAIRTLYVFDKGRCSMAKREWFYYHSNPCMAENEGPRFVFGNFKATGSVYSLFPYFYSKKNIRLGTSKISIMAAVQDTSFKYSTWERWFGRMNDLVEFFDKFAKYPCIEYLTKLGLMNLVEERLENRGYLRAIYWRGDTLFKVLRLTKQEFNELRKRNIRITSYFLHVWQSAKKLNWGISIFEAAELSDSIDNYHLNQLLDLQVYGSVRKIFAYLKHQITQKPKHDIETNLITWRDYLEACQKLHFDLTKERIVFPKNVYDAHQKAIILIKVRKDAAINKKISDRVKALHDAYYFEYRGLFIRPAASCTDLATEGTTLKHCVFTNYTEKYDDGKTIILFIRKMNEPDKPYYTMEINNNKIIQCQGLSHCNPNDEVKAFIQAFTSKKLNKKSKLRIPA